MQTVSPRGSRAGSPHASQDVAELRVVANFLANVLLTFRSFAAVPAPIFASKYAFFSMLQNLPDYAAENFEKWQNFADFATFAKMLLNFHENC